MTCSIFPVNSGFNCEIKTLFFKFSFSQIKAKEKSFLDALKLME